MSDAAVQSGGDAVADQGAATPEGNDLYQSYLQDVPEEVHDHVINALKSQDAEITKRFQSQADRMKPFEELGVFDQEPEMIGQFLSLNQSMQAALEGDPEAKEAVYSWWDQVGDALEFYEGEDEGAEDDLGDDDFDLMDMDKKGFQQMLQQQIMEAIGPLAQHLQSKEQQEAEQLALQEANQQIDGWIDELKSAHPDLFGGEDGEKVLDEVLELAELFAESSDNPIQAGFEKYQSLVGKGESSLFGKKTEQPAVPERQGPANTTPPATTMKNARDAALEHVRNAKAISG